MPSIDALLFHPNNMAIAGIPVEKVIRPHVGVEVLCRHHSFTPVMSASHWVEHGFYHGLKAFVDTVEGRHHQPLTSFQSLIPTSALPNNLSRPPVNPSPMPPTQWKSPYSTTPPPRTPLFRGAGGMSLFYLLISYPQPLSKGEG